MLWKAITHRLRLHAKPLNKAQSTTIELISVVLIEFLYKLLPLIYGILYYILK